MAGAGENDEVLYQGKRLGPLFADVLLVGRTTVGPVNLDGAYVIIEQRRVGRIVGCEIGKAFRKVGVERRDDPVHNGSEGCAVILKPGVAFLAGLGRDGPDRGVVCNGKQPVVAGTELFDGSRRVAVERIQVAEVGCRRDGVWRAGRKESAVGRAESVLPAWVGAVVAAGVEVPVGDEGVFVDVDEEERKTVHRLAVHQKLPSLPADCVGGGDCAVGVSGPCPDGNRRNADGESKVRRGAFNGAILQLLSASRDQKDRGPYRCECPEIPHLGLKIN